MSKGRLEAFSDGVFAVAITILVFNVQVPHVVAGHLWRALLEQWPAYGAYIASFLTIGVMWVNHHALFERIARVDRVLVLINLWLLAAIAFLPFPTLLMGEYIPKGGPDASAAATVYALVAILIAIGFSGIWVYVLSHPGMLHAGFDRDAARRRVPRFAAGNGAYVACLLLAQVSPIAVVAVLAAVAVYYMFESLPEIRHQDS